MNESKLAGSFSPELEPLRENLGNPEKIDRIVFLGCGTAYHAGFFGKYTIEKFARVPAAVDVSSEFRYSSPVITPRTLVVAISQSGETTDTLAAVRHAKEQGATTIGITNVVGSSITREVDITINMYAGPEIAVAASKTYTSQLAVLSLFALYVAHLRQPPEVNAVQALLHDILNLPTHVEKVLTQSASIEHIAKRYSRFDRFLYLGRHVNYPSALEGALKLKEISYIHAEGYPAGEMKHGAIALIDDDMPVVCIVSESEVHEKMLSNIREVHARKGRIIAIATKGDLEIEGLIQDTIYLPQIHEFASPILVAVAFQLFAYYIAAHRVLDVDRPAQSCHERYRRIRGGRMSDCSRGILFPDNLFALTRFEHRQLFDGETYVWEALLRLEEYVAGRAAELTSSPNARVMQGAIVERDAILGKNVIVEPYALIRGPAIIGDGAEIRHGAYVRDHAVIGRNLHHWSFH